VSVKNKVAAAVLIAGGAYGIYNTAVSYNLLKEHKQQTRGTVHKFMLRKHPDYDSARLMCEESELNQLLNQSLPRNLRSPVPESVDVFEGVLSAYVIAAGIGTFVRGSKKNLEA